MAMPIFQNFIFSSYYSRKFEKGKKRKGGMGWEARAEKSEEEKDPIGELAWSMEGKRKGRRSTMAGDGDIEEKYCESGVRKVKEKIMSIF